MPDAGKEIFMSKTTIASLICLILGATGGYAAGWYLTKKKYQDLADKEVESVKAAFNKHYEEVSKDETVSKKDIPPVEDVKVNSGEKSKKPLANFEAKEQKDYKDYSKQYRSSEMDAKYIEEKLGSKASKNKPYAISPKEFNSSELEAKSLIYWADGVLTDDDNNVIDDYADMIGDDALFHFGEYEADTVYIRNEAQQIDYEIIAELRTYGDAGNAKD